MKPTLLMTLLPWIWLILGVVMMGVQSPEYGMTMISVAALIHYIDHRLETNEIKEEK